MEWIDGKSQRRSKLENQNDFLVKRIFVPIF